jgi:hypothetical protein
VLPALPRERKKVFVRKTVPCATKKIVRGTAVNCGIFKKFVRPLKERMDLPFLAAAT